MGAKITSIVSGDVLNPEDLNNNIDEISQFLNVGISTVRESAKNDYSSVAMSAFGVDSAKGKEYVQATGVVNSKHVFKPDLFGAPSPRGNFVSGDVHWRHHDDTVTQARIFHGGATGNQWTPVPGLSSRIKIPPLHHSEDAHLVMVMVSFYAYEIGGLGDSQHPILENVGDVLHEDHGGDCDDDHKEENGFASCHGSNTQAARFRLSIDGQALSSTERTIFPGTVSNPGTWAIGKSTTDMCTSWCDPDEGPQEPQQVRFYMLGRKQHSMVYQTFLTQGVHDIGVSIKVRSPKYTLLHGLPGTRGISTLQHKHILVVCRDLVVQTYYI